MGDHIIDQSVYETEWQQIGRHTWILKAHPDPTRVQPVIGVIITENHTVLVDAGNGPEHAQVVLNWLEQQQAPPISHVIITHHHWDHLFGMGAFDGLILCHEQGYEHLKRLSGVPWSEDYLKADMVKHPEKSAGHEAKLRVIQNWENVRLRMPDITFNGHMFLHIDHLTLKLRAIGGRHAEDSISIHVVEDDIVFVGDSFYPPPSSKRQPGESFSMDVLQRLLDEEAKLYIHGHGKPWTRERLASFMAQWHKKD
ncbi:MBL fold metallo-hydrolase [Caldalkalibacillus salinus]|uniref:MBL fold metallo-hydrolase n=1 Tax=Caldalkalibacillus salinus TaxID=2803787 RepID=UPI001920C371|nr:MBL fold metallo-hydrolase [Caldalkalibacillus salinus]